MSIFSRIFGWGGNKESQDNSAQSAVEEFISLIVVYNQATVISNVGITNMKMVPEFANYKRIMKIPTVGGKLGLAEKGHIKKHMVSYYKMDPSFFKELDNSIKKNCKSVRDMQNYFFAYGNFTNDLLTFLSTEYQMRIQGALLFKALLRSTVKKSIADMMTKPSWKDYNTTTTVSRIRATAASLALSQEWMEEFVYQIYIQSRKKKKKK